MQRARRAAGLRWLKRFELYVRIIHQIYIHAFYVLLLLCLFGRLPPCVAVLFLPIIFIIRHPAALMPVLFLSWMLLLMIVSHEECFKGSYISLTVRKTIPLTAKEM